MTLYTFFIGLALVLGMWIVERRAANPVEARWTYLAGCAGGLLGTLLWHMAQYGAPLIGGGQSVWGFLLGAVATVVLYLRLRHGTWHLGDFPDAVAPALAAGIAVGRIGCLSAGCCYGVQCNLPWGITYGPGKPAFLQQLEAGAVDIHAATSLPVHPTQLYEVGYMLIALGTMLVFSDFIKRNLLRYELILGFFLYAAVARFILEFWRGDAGGRHLGPLTFAQGTTLAVSLIATALLVRVRLRHRRRTHVSS